MRDLFLCFFKEKYEEEEQSSLWILSDETEGWKIRGFLTSQGKEKAIKDLLKLQCYSNLSSISVFLYFL